MNIEKLKKMHEAAKSRRRNWDRVFDEIAYYVLPSKTGFLTDFVPGEKNRWSWRYDTTACQANKTLANHLHMALCSPSQPWFELYFNDEDLNESNAARQWSEEATERMFAAFNYSNFNGQINTFFQNLCAFGTSCLEADAISNVREPFSLVFYNVKLSDSTFAVNVHRQIDTVFREYEFTQRQAVDRFGDRFKETDSDKIKILKATIPNDDYDPTVLNSRPFEVVWMRDGEELERGGVFEFPYMVTRFDEIDGDALYGEGPGLLALPDIRTINRAKALELRGYEKAIDPPLMGAAGGVIGDLNIQAGGYTQVRDPRQIGELPGRMDLQMTQVKGEELRMSIRAAYKIDELLVPERRGQNPASATEIQVRYEQAQKALGATVGRIESELMKPLINRVFGLMLRGGQLPEMPQELAGRELQVKYVGPLAKTQISNDAVAVERLLMAEQAVAQVEPNALLVVDHVKAMRLLADRYSAPAVVLRTEREVQDIIEQRSQQAEATSERQNAMEEAATQQAVSGADMAQVELLRSVQNG